MPIKIVYTYVVADLLHIGHVTYLESAKALVGSEGHLIVGVLTDGATIEKKSRPILSFNERIRIVKSLRCVDMVVAQETYSPIPNIKKIKPDIHMESDSHSEEDLKEIRAVAKALGCEVIITPYYHAQCSSRIKDEIVKHWKGNNSSYSINSKGGKK